MSEIVSWVSWWPVALVLIGATLAVAWLLERRRKGALQALAAARGLAFEDGDSPWQVHFHMIGWGYRSNEPILDRILPAFSDRGIFERGHSRAATNVVSGEIASVGVKLFDYRYAITRRRTVGNDFELRNTRTRTHAHTVVIVRSDELNLPDFTLRPESLVHKLGSAVGFQDIDFSAFPKFSRQYLLRGADEERIRETFTPSVLNWFERHPFLQAEGCGKEIVIYSRTKTATTKLDELLRDGVEMARAFTSRRQPS